MNQNRAKILNHISDEELREFFTGMFAEMDAYPDRCESEMFRESLLVILKRQFEKLIAENKKKVEQATSDGNQQRIIELVKENTDLKKNWTDIQVNIREWEPDGSSEKTTT